VQSSKYYEKKQRRNEETSKAAGRRVGGGGRTTADPPLQSQPQQGDGQLSTQATTRHLPGDGCRPLPATAASRPASIPI